MVIPREADRPRPHDEPRLTLRLPPTIKTALKQAARRQRLSRSALVTRILIDSLRKAAPLQKCTRRLAP